jgi:hypothetical protein
MQALSQPDINEIINLSQQNPNLSQSQIAKLHSKDIERSTVSKVLKRYNIVKVEVDEYKQHKADILAGLQHKLAESITSEDIKKAPLGSKVLAIAQLIDKERLERGQATSIADSQIRVLLDMVTGQNRQDGDVIDVETAQEVEIREGLKAIPLKEDSNIK